MEPELIKTAIASCIVRIIPGRVRASWIYGSVAIGTQVSGSDLDCVIITANVLDSDTYAQLRHSFSDLQLKLGFVPDQLYPVEIFSEQFALETVQMKYKKNFDVDGDDVTELLNALVSPKILVFGSQFVQTLETNLYHQTLLGSNSAQAPGPFSTKN